MITGPISITGPIASGGRLMDFASVPWVLVVKSKNGFSTSHLPPPFQQTSFLKAALHRHLSFAHFVQKSGQL